MKLTLITVVWLLFIAGTFHALITYSGKPGESKFAISRWPAQTKLNRPFSGNHLVMFVHPGCSCSKKSLTELTKLIETHANITADIVFMKTKKLSKLLRESDLASMAQRIPRSSVQFDQNGFEATAFQAKASGEVFVYDPYGSLIFSGDIAMARSLEGEFVERSQNRRIASAVTRCELSNKEKID